MFFEVRPGEASPGEEFERVRVRGDGWLSAIGRERGGALVRNSL